MSQKALLMTSLHSLGQNDKNEIQHDYFGHATPLASASTPHDAHGIVNSTIILLMPR